MSRKKSITRSASWSFCFVVSTFLILSPAVVNAQDCNPVGLLVGGTDVNSSGVELITIGAEYGIVRAQTNTLFCREIKKTMSPESVRKLRQYVGDGFQFLAVLHKTDPPQAQYCLLDTLEIDSGLPALTKLSDLKDCQHKNLYAVQTALKEYPIIYLEKKQYEQLSSRFPSSKAEKHAHKKKK